MLKSDSQILLTTKPRFEIFNLERFHNNEFSGQFNEKEYSRPNSANAKEKKSSCPQTMHVGDKT